LQQSQQNVSTRSPSKDPDSQEAISEGVAWGLESRIHSQKLRDPVPLHVGKFDSLKLFSSLKE